MRVMQQSIEQRGVYFGNALQDVDQVFVRIEVTPAGDAQRRDVDALSLALPPTSYRNKSNEPSTKFSACSSLVELSPIERRPLLPYLGDCVRFKLEVLKGTGSLKVPRRDARLYLGS